MVSSLHSSWLERSMPLRWGGKGIDRPGKLGQKRFLEAEGVWTRLAQAPKPQDVEGERASCSEGLKPPIQESCIQYLALFVTSFLSQSQIFNTRHLQLPSSTRAKQTLDLHEPPVPRERYAVIMDVLGLRSGRCPSPSSAASGGQRSHLQALHFSEEGTRLFRSGQDGL